MTMATSPTEVTAAITRVMRDDRGRCLAILTAKIGSSGRAEDALQDAVASALVHWGRSGVPDVPRAWLLKVACGKRSTACAPPAASRRTRTTSPCWRKRKRPKPTPT